MRVVSNLNRGIDIGGNLLPSPLGLTIGAGANPAASDLHREIDRFRLKVQAGRNMRLRSRFLTWRCFMRFRPASRTVGYRFWRASGRLSVIRMRSLWPMRCPALWCRMRLLKRMAKAKTKQEGRRIGAEIAHEMIVQRSARAANCGQCTDGAGGNYVAALGRIPLEEL